VLELTMDGPTLVFEEAAVISLCGGEGFTLTVDGVAAPMWSAVSVPAGARVRIGAAIVGYRGYLAVAGGFALAPVMGSRSMYARARGLDGLAGRALVAGDVLPIGDAGGRVRADAERLAAAMAAGGWRVTTQMRPRYGTGVVRCFAGAEHASFTAQQCAWFTAEPYTLSAQADRMGLRLQGRDSLHHSGSSSRDAASAHGAMPSAPAAIGNVQVPPHGLPIVLAADGQTIGGYPRIAQVAAVDLPVLAQTRPGEPIHFQWITVDEAEYLWHARERDLALLQLTLDTLRG
jgi:antagonist of KipI